MSSECHAAHYIWSAFAFHNLLGVWLITGLVRIPAWKAACFLNFSRCWYPSLYLLWKAFPSSAHSPAQSWSETPTTVVTGAHLRTLGPALPLFSLVPVPTWRVPRPFCFLLQDFVKTLKSLLREQNDVLRRAWAQEPDWRGFESWFYHLLGGILEKLYHFFKPQCSHL